MIAPQQSDRAALLKKIAKRVRDHERWLKVVEKLKHPHAQEREKALEKYSAYLERAKKFREKNRKKINEKQRIKRRLAKDNGIKPEPMTEEQKEKAREKQRRYRARNLEKIRLKQRKNSR